MGLFNAVIGTPTMNSYITVAGSDTAAALLVDDIRVTAWLSLSPSSKEVFLMRATRMIDSYFSWGGYRYLSGQSLAWPRGYAYDFDNYELPVTAIPQKVVYATVLQAILLSEGVTIASSGVSPINHLKVGPIELRFDNDKSSAVASSISQEIIDLLRPLGEYSGSTSGIRMVPLERV